MVAVRWVDGLPPADLPVTQVYGWCFTPAGDVIVLENGGQYTLPGGRPEAGETFAQTLRREAREEAQLVLGAIRPFGYRLVEGDPTVLGGRPYVQVRAVARVARLLPPAMDPATGRWYRRMAIPPDEALRRLAWGEDGARQLAAARGSLAVLPPTARHAPRRPANAPSPSRADEPLTCPRCGRVITTPGNCPCRQFGSSAFSSLTPLGSARMEADLGALLVRSLLRGLRRLRRGRPQSG